MPIYGRREMSAVIDQVRPAAVITSDLVRGRNLAAELDDVLDEYVSVAGARRDYGVVLTGSLEDLTLALDEPATEQLRAEMRTAR